MRHAIDNHTKGSIPSVDEVVDALGALTNSIPTVSDTTDRDSRRRRGRGES